MTNRERVLALIRSEPEGIADSEIRRRTGIEPHQQVNQICRKLAQAGLIDRRRRDGRLTNLPPGSPERNPKPRERRAPDTQPAKGFVRRTHAVDGAEIPPLTISRTLFVLPCSGAKRKGGRREDNGPSVLDLLPRRLAAELDGRRADNAREANVDESALLPAVERYIGNLYQEAGDALGVLVGTGADILIISGGYGVVLPSEPIGCYDQEYRHSMWPNGLVPRCLAAYADATKPTTVVGLLAATTRYAQAFRQTHWPDGVERVFLVCPEPSPGAMAKSPRALGGALKTLSRDQRLRTGWTSGDGLEMHVARLP